MECKECEYFDGYDRGDGTPFCDYDGGYENCPYYESGETKANDGEIEIKIDLADMNLRIENAFANTINSQVMLAINKLVSEKYKDIILKKTEKCVAERIELAVDKFMEDKIKVGGGWNSTARELTREEYLAETIAEKLDKHFESDVLSRNITRETELQIDKFSKALRSDVNTKIKQLFNEATKQALTDNVVSMLMDNQTFRNLAGSMENLIGNSKS